MRKVKVITLVLLAILAGVNKMYASDGENEKSTSLIALSGQVFDKVTGESLAGVLISLGEESKPVYTDFEGKFQIDGLEPGEYSLKSKMISYRESEITVKLNGADNLPVNIPMDQAAIR